jgi:hypothetical protein
MSASSGDLRPLKLLAQVRQAIRVRHSRFGSGIIVGDPP